MQRFQELSLLYDHSQIPIFLARNNSTLEVIALQRIPISLYLTKKSGEDDAKKSSNNHHAITMDDALSTFPFLSSWSRIPRQPNLLLLREVILEEDQLFVVSERFAESLVRYLRRSGVLTRVQIRNHTLNSDGDEKHDRAAAALVARWQSEQALPDEYDVDFTEALGILSDVTNFNSSMNPAQRRKSEFAMQQQQQQRRMSVMGRNGNNNNNASQQFNVFSSSSIRSGGGDDNNNSQTSRKNGRSSTNDSINDNLVVGPLAAGHAMRRRSSALIDMVPIGVAVRSESSNLLTTSPTSKKQQQQKKRRQSTTTTTTTTTSPTERKSSVVQFSSKSPQRNQSTNNNNNNNNKETDHDTTTNIFGAHHPSGVYVEHRSGGDDNDDDGNNNNVFSSEDDEEDEEKEKALLLEESNAKLAKQGLLYDIVPDHDLQVRYSDIYRVPLSDDEVRLILFQLLSALEALHEKGFVHGSVSPKHLVLSERGNLISLRLTSFRSLSKSKHKTVPTLKEAITSAIQDSLEAISEEEEWRKRRKSLYHSPTTSNNKNGSSNRNSPLNRSQQANTNNNNSPTRSIIKSPQKPNNADGRNLVSPTRSPRRAMFTTSNNNQEEEGKKAGNNSATKMIRPGDICASSILHASAIGQFFGGPDPSQEWENEEEEILVTTIRDAMKMSSSGEEAEGENDNHEKSKIMMMSMEENKIDINSLRIPNSRFYDRQDVKKWMTVTHAAPELILGYMRPPVASASKQQQQQSHRCELSSAADIWSAAMTALELYTARPLLYGETPRDVFFRAASEFCGCPSRMQDPEFHRWAMHATSSNLPNAGIVPIPLASVAPMAGEDAIDLLNKMLRLDPSERISAKDALEHPFFLNGMIEEEEEDY